MNRSKTAASRRPSAAPTGDRPQAPEGRAAVRLLLMPLALIVALASFGFLPQIRSNPLLLAAFESTSGVLLIWWAVLAIRSRGRSLKTEIVLRPEHYMQTVAQLSIYVYWSLYWDPIREAAPLIAAQVVFAYAFDMLLTWSRRDTHLLTFGPFPIIFSINLFLRFRNDRFALQFVMVAIGFLAKEFIRWNKDGRRVHIFNPSSFPLAVVSVVLLLTNTTHLTWGEDIATQLFRPPQIYLFLFLVSLPGQYRFGVTTMSLSAILTTYMFGLAYFAATGTYFFVDTYVPVAVFLGMLLLFVDPATAPKTELGRIIFGTLYGATTVGLYALLEGFGLPTFYDKLLQVPFLNLSVQVLDRLARSPRLAWLDPSRMASAIAPQRRRLAYTSLWVVVFSAMSFAQGVGDHHPGHNLPFWQRACEQNLRNGCRTLASIESTLCSRGSGWACNEYGVRLLDQRMNSPQMAVDAFRSACATGFTAGCQNALLAVRAGAIPARPLPGAPDFAVLLREGKGALPEMTPFQLFTRACAQGWMTGCAQLADAYLRGDGTAKNYELAEREYSKACEGGVASACSDIGYMYKIGEGVARDDTKALGYLKKACDLGMSQACRWLKEQQRPAAE
jgi:hypothetical protein